MDRSKNHAQASRLLANDNFTARVNRPVNRPEKPRPMRGATRETAGMPIATQPAAPTLATIASAHRAIAATSIDPWPHDPTRGRCAEAGEPWMRRHRLDVPGWWHLFQDQIAEIPATAAGDTPRRTSTRRRTPKPAPATTAPGVHATDSPGEPLPGRWRWMLLNLAGGTLVDSVRAGLLPSFGHTKRNIDGW